MNLVGKIFVVLILVMSLVFMAFSVAVYATRENWREVAMRPASEAGPDKPLGLTHLVKKQEIQIRELRDQKITLEGEIAAQCKAHDQAVAKFDSKYGQLRDQFDELETACAKLGQERRDAQSALNSIQVVLGHLRKEIDTLRKNTAEAEKDRDAHFKQVLKLTDELHQLIDERQRQEKELVALRKRLGGALKVLRHYELNPEDPLTEPPRDGIVLAVPEPGLCEISLGSDDGFKKGYKLEVFRAAGGAKSYVGRIHVVKTSFDRSACRVDPGFQKSPIQKGDRVTSRIPPRIP